MEVQKHFGSVGVAINAKQERNGKGESFLRIFCFNLSMYQSALASRNRKSSEDSQRKLSIKQSVDRLNTTHK